MSLWTPDGEHNVGDDRPSGLITPGEPPQLSDEQRAEAEAIAQEMAEARARLASVPAAVVVANHAMGLYELAAIHLGAQPANLSESKIAIDAFAALVEAVRDELGEDGTVMTDALAQIRLAYVQIANAQQAGADVATDAPPSADDPAAD